MIENLLEIRNSKFEIPVLAKQKRSGFTLLELLLYIGIFSVAAIFLTGIFTTTLRVQTKQSSGNAVAQQLNFVLDTVQRLVRTSSLVECVDSSSNITEGVCPSGPSNVGDYLKLRFENNLKDPTCIYLSGGNIVMAEGPGATANVCTTATTNLTNSAKVKNISLQFIKSEVAGGHALVQVDSSMSYNSDNLELQATKSISSVIGRVSAATFDSDILPNVTEVKNIGGSTSKWQDGWFSRDLNVAGDLNATGNLKPPSGIWNSSGNVGIGTTTPTSGSALDVVGYAQFRKSGAGAPTATDCDSAGELGRLYIDTTNNRLYVCNGATRLWDYLTLTDF